MTWQIVHEQMSRADGLVMLVYDYLSSLNSRPAADPRLGRLRTLALNRRVSRTHAPKSDMRGRAVRSTLPTCTGKIAGAILVAAQERSAPLDALGDAGLAGIVARRWPGRVALGRVVRNPGDTSRCTIPRRCRRCRTGRSRWGETSRPERCGRIRRPRCSDRGNVPPRYWLAISRPGAVRRPRRNVHAPCRRARRSPIRPRSAAACRPIGVSDGVVPANLDDGIVVFPFDRAAGPFRMPPVGAGDVAPPDQGIVERDPPAGGVNTIEPGTSFSGGASGKSLGSGGRSAIGDVGGLLDESRKLAVGDLGPIHPEPGDGHFVNRLGVGHRRIVGPHPERAAGNPDHPFGRRTWGDGFTRRGRFWASGLAPTAAQAGANGGLQLARIPLRVYGKCKTG